LTAEAVHALEPQGYRAQDVAACVALWMGVYGIILGFLKLGFLLEFISEPVLTGFISAAAIIIGSGQIKNLIGQSDIGDGFANIVHDTFATLPDAKGKTAAIGMAGIVILIAMQMIATRWGKQHKWAWLVGILRAFTVLVLFTGVSYGVNKNRDEDDYLFAVTKMTQRGIIPPKVPDSTLLNKSATHAIAAFIAAAVEHVAIARAFGARGNYMTDPSQELCYLGITNFVNSFFNAMGVGGAMSRTAVNASCNVRSPLSGFVTTAAVLICLYELTDALYWIPKATLAAIVITAIWPLIGHWRTYYNFWRTSLADFIAAMLAFWLTLFVNSETGIGVGVGWSIVYYLLRLAWQRTQSVGSNSRSEIIRSIDAARGMPSHVPDDVRIFRFNENIFFPNATRVKNQLIDGVKTHHAPSYSSANGAEADRIWSVVGEQRVAKLRKRAGITDPSGLPPIRLVIIDFTKVTHTDATAMHVMKEVFAEIRKYGGKDVEIRFAAIQDNVRHRFERSGWDMVDADSSTASGGSAPGPKTVMCFKGVGDAMTGRGLMAEQIEVVVGKSEESPQAEAEHREKV
jgi:solute carrier family 26 (sodium-independent sulfate anion transporter), member 11